MRQVKLALPLKTASLAEVVQPKQGDEKWQSYQGCDTRWSSSSKRYASVLGGQSLAAASKILGIAAQTLHNWVKAERQGHLPGQGKPVDLQQMELARLHTENARLKMERDILEKATAYFAKARQ